MSTYICFYIEIRKIIPKLSPNSSLQQFLWASEDSDQARGYKTFFMLNSAEHENFSVINMKMPTIVGIFIFISREIFMLSYVKQERICNC